MRCRNARGFTLSETLAVIAILAALAALLFPTFTQAKKSSKTTVCVSVLHQMAVATSLYLGDEDDHYPRVINAFERITPDFQLGRSVHDDPRLFPTIAQALKPYTKSDSLFQCPSDLGWRYEEMNAYPRFWMFNGGVSYLVAELFKGQTSSTWPDPSSAVFSCDASPEWHTPDYSVMDLKTWRTVRLFYDWHVAYQHGNGVDYGQGD